MLEVTQAYPTFLFSMVVPSSPSYEAEADQLYHLYTTLHITWNFTKNSSSFPHEPPWYVIVSVNPVVVGKEPGSYEHGILSFHLSSILDGSRLPQKLSIWPVCIVIIFF